MIRRSSRKPTLNHACKRDRRDPSRAASRGSDPAVPSLRPLFRTSRRSFTSATASKNQERRGKSRKRLLTFSRVSKLILMVGDADKKDGLLYFFVGKGYRETTTPLPPCPPPRAAPLDRPRLGPTDATASSKHSRDDGARFQTTPPPSPLYTLPSLLLPSLPIDSLPPPITYTAKPMSQGRIAPSPPPNM